MYARGEGDRYRCVTIPKLRLVLPPLQLSVLHPSMCAYQDCVAAGKLPWIVCLLGIPPFHSSPVRTARRVDVTTKTRCRCTRSLTASLITAALVRDSELRFRKRLHMSSAASVSRISCSPGARPPTPPGPSSSSAPAVQPCLGQDDTVFRPLCDVLGACVAAQPVRRWDTRDPDALNRSVVHACLGTRRYRRCRPWVS